MNKPTIIAICGKSASGKDTLADWLCQILRFDGYRAKVLVGDTTRPKRSGEIEGKSYHYMTNKEFQDGIDKGIYLEVTSFNNWLYGTRKEEVEYNTYNIGVFNPEGMIKLSKFQNEYEIIPIYIECDIITRIRRSYLREGYFQWEYIRRAYADWKDFKILKSKEKMYSNWLYLDGKDTPYSNAQTIIDTIWRDFSYMMGNSR